MDLRCVPPTVCGRPFPQTRKTSQIRFVSSHTYPKYFRIRKRNTCEFTGGCRRIELPNTRREADNIFKNDSYVEEQRSAQTNIKRDVRFFGVLIYRCVEEPDKLNYDRPDQQTRPNGRDIRNT